MARQFDRNNLTVGDVFRAIAPLIAVIGAVYLVNRHFPEFVGLTVVSLIGLLIFGLWTLPRKDLHAMAEFENRRNEKIKAVPIVGPALNILRQALDWVSMTIGVIMLVGLAYWAVSTAFF